MAKNILMWGKSRSNSRLVILGQLLVGPGMPWRMMGPDREWDKEISEQDTAIPETRELRLSPVK
jgi:hypothetical protein